MTVAAVDRAWSRVLGATQVVADVAERHWAWLLAVCTAVYIVVVGQIAAGKPFENDELFTLYMARLPTMADVYGALLAGGEQLPPFFFLITRAALRLGTNPQLWLRLPAIAGYWVMSLCVFRFVARRTGRLLAFVALLLPLSTTAYYYAFEARPYGLVLGFSGLALVCWQAQCDSQRRLGWLLGLTLSLAGAVSSHYYAVLVLIPFGCGELMRMLERRRIDLTVWASLLASLAPLLLFLPLVERARSYSRAFWTTPSWGDMPDFFYSTMSPAALPLTAMMLVSALYATLGRDGTGPSTDSSSRGLTLTDLATTVGFLLIPLVAVTAAMLVTGAYTHRYALPAIIGLTVLITVGLRPLLDTRTLVLLLTMLLLAVGFVRRGGMTRQDSQHRVQNREAVVALLRSQPDTELPIVCTNQHDFMILSEYAPADIRVRLVYLADPAISMRLLHHDSLERGMLDLLGPWFKMNVQPYQTFMSLGRPFLVFGDHQFSATDPSANISWLLEQLVSSGRPLLLRSREADGNLFLVGAPQSAVERR